MTVSLNALPSKLFLETKSNYRFQYCLIYRNSMVTHNNSIRKAFLGIPELPPGMVSDVVYLEPLLRVGVQDLGKDVFGILGKVLWNFVLSCQYFLIQFRGFRVFEGETTAKHCIQDNSATPDIDEQRFILILAFDHFGCSVTGRSASGLKCLSRLVGVAETKVNNFNVLLFVKKEVFRFKIAVVIHARFLVYRWTMLSL